MDLIAYLADGASHQLGDMSRCEQRRILFTDLLEGVLTHGCEVAWPFSHQWCCDAERLDKQAYG